MTANYSTREYREKLYDDLHVRLRDTAILMCAIFIASIGLNTNSTAVIIGAMLISPLMTPIVGLGFGLANGNVRFLLGALYLFLINCVFIMLANIVGTRILMRKSPLTSFKELSIKMRIGLISLIVLLILPASYSAVTLTIEQARKEGIKQFVGKEFANYTVINQVYKSSNNELVLTVVGDPISEEELETIRQKQASYGIQSVQLKVNQVHNSTKLDSEMTKEFYETINKYIDQKLSEKDSQDNIVKEIEADKD